MKEKKIHVHINTPLERLHRYFLAAKLARLRHNSTTLKQKSTLTKKRKRARLTLEFTERSLLKESTKPIKEKLRGSLPKPGNLPIPSYIGIGTPHTPQRTPTKTMPFLSPTPNLALLSRTGGRSGQPTPIGNLFSQSRTSSSPSKLQNITTTPLRARHASQAQPILLLQQQLLPPQQQRENIYLICLQHSLDTTASLLEKLKEKNLMPEHIYFLDKLYSTNEKSREKVCRAIGKDSNIIRLRAPTLPWLYGKNMKTHIQQLYAKVIEDIAQSPEKPSKIILLDDGGRLIQLAPPELLKQYPIYGVEQTTAGHNRLKKHPPKLPWISFATSKLKRNEDPFIGELAEQRITSLLLDLKAAENYEPKQMRCGIIGLGHIGEAVATSLVKKGYQVFFYDTDDSKIFDNTTKCTNVGELIEKCNFIIGCTGKNTLKNIEIQPLIMENKYFMSISSEAIEFKSIMKHYVFYAQNMREYEARIFMDLKYAINGHAITFINAGYPVTFDTQKQHAVEPEKIAITRAGLFASVMQWLYHTPSPEDDMENAGAEPTPLDDKVQEFIINEWHKTMADTNTLENKVQGFITDEWSETMASPDTDTQMTTPIRLTYDQ